MARAPWWQGKRGEWYVAAQMALFALIAVGPRTWHGWPPWRFPDSREAWLAGWALIALGGVFGLSAVARFGTRLTPLPYPSPGGELVQTGVYRVVRHPMYCGALLAAVGWALVRRGWLTLGCAALLFIVFDLKVRREEAWLLDRFPAYAEYRRRVSKMIPFIY
jgi:protein-S-isoprenylcysteine O-methyltransferase Ste14